MPGRLGSVTTPSGLPSSTFRTPGTRGCHRRAADTGQALPLRDVAAGQGSYGGGRYALDAAKGADLGGPDGRLAVDLNFLYHPSCRYSDEWQCPLAPPGDTISAAVAAGGRL